MSQLLRPSVLATKNFAFPLQALLALAGVTGCDGVVQNDLPPEPLPYVCAEGSHLETVCEAGDSPGCESYAPDGQYLIAPCEGVPSRCFDQCVPDVCPAGSVAQEICVVPEPIPSCPPGAECASACAPGSDCVEVWTAPVACHFECVPAPVDPCGEGFHSEHVCAIPVGSEQACAPEEPCPPPPVDCFEQCVPDSECPEGTHPVTQCLDECDGEVCTQSCATACEAYGIDDAGPTPPQP